jgi:predicted negative regulator of RcsB-dependent stress response
MTGKTKPKKKQELKDHTRIYGLIIILFAFVLYGNSIRNDYNLDDEFVTNGNPQIAKGIKAIPEIFTTLYSQRQNLSYGYRPVVKATYAIEYQFFGWNAHISHFINVLLYSLCCLLLLLVLFKVFKNYNSKLLFIIVLIFTAHPVHTEVVNSLKNRDEILSLLFALASTLAFFKYFDTRGIIALITGILCFVLAVLSKLNAVTFIVIIPLAVYFMNIEKAPSTEDFRIKTYNLGFYFSKFKELIRNGVLIFFISAHLYLIFILYDIKFPQFIFYFLFLASAILFIIDKLKGKNSQRKIKVYIISFIFLTIVIAAFFNKIPSVSLLLFILGSLILFLIIKGKQNFNELVNYAKAFIRKNYVFIIILAILIVIFLLTFYLPKTYLPETKAKVEYWQNPQYFADQSSYITNGFYTLLYYGKLLIFPHQLSFYYGYNMFPTVGILNLKILLSIQITFLLLYYAFKTFKKRNIISFGILFYFISLSMFSNFYVPVAGIVGERLIFIASAGFSIVVGAFIFLVTKSPFTGGKLKKSSVIVFAIILILYSVKTISRNPDWKDRHSLFSADIGHLQNSVKANDLMAALLFGEAKKDIDKSRSIESSKAKLNKVIEYYKQAINVYPDHFNAYYNIGLVYLIYYRDYNNAINNFENCLRINPDFNEAYPDLAYSYSMTGNMKKAIQTGEILLSKDSNNITNIAFLSDLRLKNKDYDICNKLNQKIISLSPDSEIGYISQGNLLIAMGDTLKALESMEKAFEKNRSNKNTAIALYNFYNRTGNKEKTEYYKNLLNNQVK